MHYSINYEDIKTEIEKLGHSVRNISSIKQCKTKLPLSMSFVKLQPSPNSYVHTNTEEQPSSSKATKYKN
jgi:hypothetical protein